LNNYWFEQREPAAIGKQAFADYRILKNVTAFGATVVRGWTVLELNTLLSSKALLASKMTEPHGI